MFVFDINKFVSVDFETATRFYNSACSIGIVVVENLEIVSEEYYLIKPPRNEYDDTNINIHKITREDTCSCEAFDLVWEKIKHHFDHDAYITAFNATFDLAVLKACLSHYNIKNPDFYYLDSLAISRHCGLAGKLPERAKALGIIQENHHNALDDAKVNALLVIECFKFLKDKIGYDCLNKKMKKSLNSFENINLIESINFYKRFRKIDTARINSMELSKELVPDVDFQGKLVVFTGELKSMDRETAMKMVVERGGIVSDSITKKVNILVNTNKVDTTKVKKAKEWIGKGLNIQIIDEETFLEYLE